MKGSADDITFQASTSSALSLVAANLEKMLRPKDKILIVQDQMSRFFLFVFAFVFRLM